MPDDAPFAGRLVALALRRFDGADHAGPRLADRAELVIAGDFFDDVPPLVLLERHARPQIVQQRRGAEQFADQRLQRRLAPPLPAATA